MPDEVLAVTKSYDILLWLIKAVERFPRSHRFTLGDRIINKKLDILESLIKASYSRDKKKYLNKANLDLEVLRYLMRLSKDTKILSLRRYEYISREMDELGRQIGGWSRSSGRR